nr:MAG TPA: hypothetical protein [Caudoviricetes sp.]DAP21161.1 MAG TPA: hypothetical protein [Caudoviricetes sp.]
MIHDIPGASARFATKRATNMTNLTMLVTKLHKSLIIVYNHL